MPDDERNEAEESDDEDYARRFKEIEERARKIVENARVPDPPRFDSPVKPPELSRSGGPRTKQPLPPHVSNGLGIALAIGYSFVGPLLAGILIGSLLDGRPGGTWTLVGILVGTVSAFVLLIRLVNKLNKDDS